MKNNLFAFVEGNIVFMISDSIKLKMFNLMGQKQVKIVELLPLVETKELQFTGSTNLKYLLFKDTLGNPYYWITEWPSEISYEDAVFLFQEPDCDNDGSNIINNDYSND